MSRRPLAASSSAAKNEVLQESLRKSVDLTAYMPWQTLSTDVATNIREGSARINHSNQVVWASIEEGSSEGSPLLENSRITLSRHHDINTSEYDQTGSTGSWRVGVFLLVNCALGAGVLNYPMAYDRLGGIAISTALQILVIALLASTMLVLVLCAELHRDTAYHDVLRSMCGHLTQQLSGISIMLTCFGINITLLIIIGDQFDRILHTFVGDDFCSYFYFSRQFTISVSTILFIWPMCYYKRLDFLRHVSFFGTCAMLYVVFLNIYEYYKLDIVPGEFRTKPANTLEMIASLPVICFAYQTHEIVVPFYATMNKPRSKNFGKVIIASMIVLFVLYMLAGTYGYLTFGSRVIADIIQMYDARDPVVAVGIVALIVKMIATYPPLMFCGRGALEGLYGEIRKLSTEDYIRGERKRRILITSLWNIAVLILAVVTPDISIAISMLGSLASCNVFVFPGMCLVSLARRHLTGYYGTKTGQTTRHLLKNIDQDSFTWRTIWKSLVGYGVFLILLGIFMFIVVIVQVHFDIQKMGDASVLMGSNHTAPSQCGIHLI